MLAEVGGVSLTLLPLFCRRSPGKGGIARGQQTGSTQKNETGVKKKRAVCEKGVRLFSPGTRGAKILYFSYRFCEDEDVEGTTQVAERCGAEQDP